MFPASGRRRLALGSRPLRASAEFGRAAMRPRTDRPDRDETPRPLPHLRAARPAPPPRAGRLDVLRARARLPRARARARRPRRAPNSPPQRARRAPECAGPKYRPFLVAYVEGSIRSMAYLA